MTTVVSWNINRCEATWIELLETGADIALLQEVSGQQQGIPTRVDLGPY